MAVKVEVFVLCDGQMWDIPTNLRWRSDCTMTHIAEELENLLGKKKRYWNIPRHQLWSYIYPLPEEVHDVSTDTYFDLHEELRLCGDAIFVYSIDTEQLHLFRCKNEFMNVVAELSQGHWRPLCRTPDKSTPEFDLWATPLEFVRP
jgi:hypothetical protein